MKQEASAPVFKRLVVLFNPASSKADQAKLKIAQLEKAYPGQVVVDETKPDAAGNLKVLLKILRPGDILIPAGGDGSLNQVLVALLDPKTPPELRSTRVLPLGTGKMNDVAHMLNGKHFNDPEYVLRHGHEVPIYPLTFTVTPVGSKKPVDQQIGVYNIGFGSIGLGTMHYNDPAFRMRQQQRAPAVQEFVLLDAARKIWFEAEPFEITYKGKQQQIYNILVSSGNIMAGYWRFPARLSKQEFFVAMVDKNGTFAFVDTALRLFTNKAKGEVMQGPLSFTLHGKVHGQIDGEVYTVPTPCRITLGHHAEPVIMLVTNPKA
jgi:diacylglycerol kinase family enzyme